MLDDLWFSKDALKHGDMVPNHKIYTDDGAPTSVHDLINDKPVMLITGSITCPMTIGSLADIADFQGAAGDKIDIVMIYVREAHPGENFPQSESLECPETLFLLQFEVESVPNEETDYEEITVQRRADHRDPEAA